MILSTWSQVLSDSFKALGQEVILFIPKLVIAVLVFILGWAIGALIGRVVAKIIDAIRIDEALRRAGVEEMVKRGGLNLNSGKFVGGLVKWFIIIWFLIAVLNILSLNQVNFFLEQVVLNYLPQVIVAVLILL